jgi:RNA polymerase sigma-70 factor (ECF subfamily)
MSSDNIRESETSRDRNSRWEEFISQAAKGSEDAFSALYDESNWLVYSLALKVLNDQEDAEEVTLDVFKYVWANASNYNSDRSNPSTWLVMLTRSRAIDKLRTRKAQSQSYDLLEYEMADPDSAADSDTLHSQNRKIILDALSELNEKQRKVVELAYFYQYSQSEIADMLEMPIGSVKSTVRLATEKLKKTLSIIK